MRLRKYLSLFLRQSEYIWCRKLLKLAVDYLERGFQGSTSIMDNDSRIEICSKLYLNRLNSVVVRDSSNGYLVTAVEPDLERDLKNVQVFVRKSVRRTDTTKFNYWQRVMYVLYSRESKTYTLSLAGMYQDTVTRIFVKGTEAIWLRRLWEHGVRLYLSDFSGSTTINMPFSNSVSFNVDIRSTVYKQHLRAIEMFDGANCYRIRVVQPNPDKGAIRPQIYVSKSIMRGDERIWWDIFHLTYDIPTQSFTYIIFEEDEHPMPPAAVK